MGLGCTQHAAIGGDFAQAACDAEEFDVSHGGFLFLLAC